MVVKDISGINRDIRKRLAKAIQDRLSSHPESYGKPLRGDLAGYWTLRVGDYRAVYRVVKNEVWILAVMNRRDVYSQVMNRLSWDA
ncbi:MAG: type II toxin-antitoxin system mRNA interferase toxin, RelE/StbE family [Elusimicrobia bacterium]|nr:type II toxin-antitoxin system mRNA interferase toxin, RelE/StbE family [Elusimicrobiota bacterium]